MFFSQRLDDFPVEISGNLFFKLFTSIRESFNRPFKLLFLFKNIAFSIRMNLTLLFWINIWTSHWIQCQYNTQKYSDWFICTNVSPFFFYFKSMKMSRWKINARDFIFNLCDILKLISHLVCDKSEHEVEVNWIIDDSKNRWKICWISINWRILYVTLCLRFDIPFYYLFP